MDLKVRVSKCGFRTVLDLPKGTEEKFKPGQEIKIRILEEGIPEQDCLSLIRKELEKHVQEYH